MNTGWYRLKCDVTNPKPDRRSKRRNDAVVWNQGIRVEVRENHGHTEDKPNFVLYFWDNSMVFSYDPGYQELLAALEPVPVTIGQLDRSSIVGIKGLLGLAIDKGLITIEQLQQLEEEAKQMDDDLFESLNKRHWL